MTSSDAAYQRAAEVLAKLTVLLDHRLMAREIDDPIDEVTQGYRAAEGDGAAHNQLHREAPRFVQAIYEKALPCHRKLSLSQAHDEAVALLEHEYQGTRAGGYDGALLDVADSSQPGIPLVLARIADAIKRRERRMYENWVVARHVDPGDWRTKCAMAEILWQRCRPFLPPEVRCRPVEELADGVSDLLLMDLATSVQAGQSLARSPNLPLSNRLADSPAYVSRGRGMPACLDFSVLTVPRPRGRISVTRGRPADRK